MRNCLKKFLVIAFVLLAPILGDARDKPGASVPLLVTDMADDIDITIKKFRTTQNLANKNLSDLKVSASGQFSADGLEKLFSTIPAPKKNIWIIDVRQESHGFINGTPISWYGDQNGGNINKSPSQIAQEEQELLTDLSKQLEVKVYSAKKLPNGEITAGDERIFIPHKVESEQQLVTEAGANYMRLYVLDHNRPDDPEVDRFVTFIKTKVKPEDWLHFHCRGGKGRSSTFMAMYDMIQNARHSSLEQIMRRQASMGNINFYKMPVSTEKQWKLASATARFEFLQNFYAYTSDPNSFAKRSWSEWLNSDSY